MTREFKIYPAYDKRHPDPSKNCGIHGCELLFLVKGEKGAVQFRVFTDWHLPHVQTERGGKPTVRQEFNLPEPMGADVGYHSFVPMYEGQSSMGPCPHLDGKECYYDGSTLRAGEWVRDILLPLGSDGVWAALEDEYRYRFEREDKHDNETETAEPEGRPDGHPA